MPAIKMNSENANSRTKAPPDYELWASLDTVGFAVYRLRELELARFRLTVEQAALLRSIQTMGRGTTLKEIEDATLRQQNTISILINRMAAMRLLTKERNPGKRHLTILISEKGRHLLKRLPVTSLEMAFSALSPKERRRFAYLLHSLREKARSLLVPETPPFMQYIGKGVSGETTEHEGREEGRYSGYMLWSSLNATRFAISRLRELELARFGLTVEQASILKVLIYRGTPVRTKDLEDATLRQHHSISTLVNRMMRMGLVAKEKRLGERSQWIFVTGIGTNLFNGITTAAIDVTFSVLSDTEKQQLAACLQSLYVTARNLLGLVSGPSSAVVPSSQRP